MNNLMVKNAGPEDRNLLFEGLIRTIQELKIDLDDPYLDFIPEAAERDCRERVKEFFAKPDHQLLIAWSGDQPAGLAAGWAEKPFVPFSKIRRIARLELCWVYPKFRQKGAASLLANAFEAWAKTKGIEWIELSYMAGNQVAHFVWESNGFGPYRIIARKKIE
ncbi:MAG: hypothetical protein A2527_10985 [Candidatus Lambdaproteobacteria bacterium RIFOXYD2_FULL_50_16]|uniref:N-acetyltransferase domain-containing protein n=1 Tax=Candidatus Lambdaproteobacteria bacterium RIFOXYD2_FULL_50_16 TaxID=1817772 RepID=A0A1F6G695_9PROT|nr:MAG: hypothetical protein A2527_10985 [Candidatus Lambdaproteobacteria bacterium RIFOXYD2_FULL_50_16]